MSDRTLRQAMVLAAGLGKRMGTLTQSRPKPMIEVSGCTMIDRALDNLEHAGVEKAVVNTFYMADMLEDHLMERPAPFIIISREADLLETGGGVKKALHHFGEEAFFVVNSDVIWFEDETPALKKLADAWDDALDALLLLHPLETAVGYEGKGDFFLDAHGGVKRKGNAASAPYVFTGMQILHPRLFADCPEGAFSLNVLYDKALAVSPPRLRAIVHEGALLNVGDPQGKKLAEDYIVNLDRRTANR